MSTTIKRKAPSARQAATAHGNARRLRQAKARTGSALDRLMAWVPLGEAGLHRLFLALVLALAAGLAWAVAAAAGLGSLATGHFAQVAADAGFEVRGVKHMNELKVYERVLGERERAMPLVDLDALRADLLRQSWVADARVSRQLPDTLVIDIVERRPHAVLRKPGGRMMLIDATGRELEPIAPQRVGRMLVVSGPGSGRQVAELDRLIATAPALRPQLREAEWIGNRRWNLTFRTGQVLALPEGDRASATALLAFARLDGANRLLGGRVVAFDMRSPDRIYLRVPGLARQEAALAAARKQESH
jgi:cell division protein FtsQ